MAYAINIIASLIMCRFLIRLVQGNPTKEKRHSIVDLLVLIAYICSFYIENFIFYFTKQATLIRRSIVLGLPRLLVFHS